VDGRGLNWFELLIFMICEEGKNYRNEKSDINNDTKVSEKEKEKNELESRARSS
jgi:hypothetical protein